MPHERAKGRQWQRDHPTKAQHPPFTKKDTGPFCGAQRRRQPGVFCKLPAGFKTPHPGQGRCYLHGGCSKVRTNGRYANILHKSVREKLDTLASIETDIMDLGPEAQLLRALIADYINRYEEFHTALLAWYADDDGKKSTKPRKILDLADAARLIEGVSRVIHRIHQIQSTGAISLETFRRVTEQMGIVVAKYVLEPKVLEKIEADWMSIAVDAKSVNVNEQDIEDFRNGEEKDI